MNKTTSVDLAVVGSGLAGMMSAVRAHDLGLRVVVIEKSAYYGGTSTFSGGGIWIPNHLWQNGEDTPERVLSYLRTITRGKGDDRKFEAFIENAPLMANYALSLGAGLHKEVGLPDYFSEVDGYGVGRQLTPNDFDGKCLGEEFHRMRMTYPGYMAFDRYQMGLSAIGPLISRQKGWLWQAFKLVAGYWADIGWRFKTSRDSRLSLGSAFVGCMRKAMMDRDIPLLLNTSLTGLEKKGDRVTGIRVSHNGNERSIAARTIILAAGGFDQNQEMRDKYHPVRTAVTSSLTPPGGNEGDAIRLGQAIGADIENMEHSWWCPTVIIPGRNNTRVPAGQVFWDRGRPGTVCVNRLGRRFVNEACSYDRFGHAMIEDQKKTGANVPCWMIFDARYRHNFNVSNLMPGWASSDRKLPPDYWDNVLYCADTIDALARKIEIDPEILSTTIRSMNEYARTGRDLEFNRGELAYDKAFGDPRGRPNTNLGPIDKAPFYAVKLELGDLGTKGGLRVDEHARVLDTVGNPIEGLYATGNTTGSLFVDTYPGPGSTLGAAMTFAFVAVNHAADKLPKH